MDELEIKERKGVKWRMTHTLRYIIKIKMDLRMLAFLLLRIWNFSCIQNICKIWVLAMHCLLLHSVFLQCVHWNHFVWLSAVFRLVTALYLKERAGCIELFILCNLQFPSSRAILLDDNLPINDLNFRVRHIKLLLPLPFSPLSVCKPLALST